MKITYSRNKMFAEICEMNNSEYLQKLIYAEIMLKHPALSNHPKISTTKKLI